MESKDKWTFHLITTGEEIMNKTSFWYARSFSEISDIEPITLPSGLLELARQMDLEDDLHEIGLTISVSNRRMGEESLKTTLMFEMDDDEEFRTLGIYSLEVEGLASSLVFTFPYGAEKVPSSLWVKASKLDHIVVANVIGDNRSNVRIMHGHFFLKQTRLWEFGDTGFEGELLLQFNLKNRGRELILPGTCPL